MESFQKRIAELEAGYEALVTRPNVPDPAYNGIYTRYRYPILTAAHAPLFWRYDLDPRSNPYCMERIGVNAVMNSGAIKFNGRYLIMARVEGADRKSFFAVAESPNGIDNFRFWDYPVTMPEYGEPATNVYDMRLTAHEDGWIYGVFCVERKDPAARPGDLSSAVASAGIARTKDLVNWERLPDLKSRHQQRNAVLHPEFIDGKYAFYTRPQEGFIEAGNGGGIGWALIDDITHAEVREERIINCRYYHTIKEVKNGEGPHPIRTPQGWLHLAHGVRGCAAGLRYVLYLYMTELERPWIPIAEPGGLLIFDVNTPYKHREVLGDNAFVFEEEGLLCVWRNRLIRRTCEVEILLDFFVEEGARYTRYEDTVRERAYSRQTLERLLEQAGFLTEAVYADMETTAPGEECQRWVFVARNHR